MNTEFFEIENRAGKLKLNDGVHKESADKLIEEMDRLYGHKAVAAQMMIGEVIASADEALESVEVEINSPGGSVFEGMRIYRALRNMSERGVHVTTVVNELAASMGSVILMAGDKRKMYPEGRIMIHEPSSIVAGDARDMKRQADLLESIADDLANIYANRSGYDKEKIRDLMLAETWMGYDQAVEVGFVTDPAEDLDNSGEPAMNNGMSIFARLFPNAAAEQIEAAQAEVDRIAADLEAVTAERDTHAATITEQSATIAAHLETIQDVTAERDTAQADATAKAEQIETLTAELEAAKESAGKQATQILASIGQSEPLDEPEAVSAKTITIDAFWEEYNNLKKSDPKAATTFFREHAERLGLKAQ